MSNELLFFFHAIAIIAFTFIALRLGKQALTALICAEGILGNLFVIKQISIFGWIITPTDVFTIGSLFSLNLLREYFGKEAAKTALFSTLLSLAFFAMMGKFHLGYVPSSFDTTQEAFQRILHTSPRILLASIFSYGVTQLFDLYIFGKLKARIHSFTYRTSISIGLSQLLDTALFSFLALYGIATNIWHIILISYLVKVFTLLLIAPATKYSKRFYANAI